MVFYGKQDNVFDCDENWEQLFQNIRNITSIHNSYIILIDINNSYTEGRIVVLDFHGMLVNIYIQDITMLIEAFVSIHGI